MQRSDVTARRALLKTGLTVVGAGVWSEALFPDRARANQKESAAAVIGPRELIKGLDGMSRVAEPGNDPFTGGHSAAAVMASAFFCREQKLDCGTQKEILSLVEARLLTNPIYEPRQQETSDPALVEGLVSDLDAGIGALRRSGHNIIFAAICLKALRELPQAATPARVTGLRKMVQSFGSGKAGGSGLQKDGTLVNLSDEGRFVRFVFEEYLKALDLYLNGKGHHGFAGHLLTIGHALLELHRAGYPEIANKGVEAYWQFVRQARDGADLDGEKVKPAPMQSPNPREREYWIAQGQRPAGLIVSSHLIKYPYSLFALAKEVRDEALRRRIAEKLYYLTANS